MSAKDKFMCMNCGSEVFPRIVRAFMPVSKKELQGCINNDGDFGPLYTDAQGCYPDEVILVCDCDKAKLSNEDIEMIEEYMGEVINNDNCVCNLQ